VKIRLISRKDAETQRIFLAGFARELMARNGNRGEAWEAAVQAMDQAMRGS
jgi:hypothetical protein